MSESIEPKEETEQERRNKYRKLRADGVQDNIARETVWPSTTVGRDRNIKEKADKDEKDAKQKEAKEE